MVRLIERVFAQIAGRYPGTVPAVVGSLSRKHGGRLRPHKSHQSGRDVDIGYFWKGNKPLSRFVRVGRKTLDAEKSWALIEALIRTGQVMYIFVDYRLQPLLREAARRVGWPEEELSSLFQYPDGRRNRRGLIRHSRGHTDHLHVRFICHPRDDLCRD